MNPLAGDRKVTIAGVEYVLHPDFVAFGEIEALCPEGAHQLFLKSLKMLDDPMAGLGLRQTAAVLWACIKGEKRPSFVEFGGMLMRDGYRQHAQLCMDILALPFPPPDRVEKKTEVPAQTDQSGSPGMTTTAPPSSGSV